jgi:hypothetical protein
MHDRCLSFHQYNFEGRYDIVKFFKLIQDNGMYAMVRIGPYVQAEWNHGFACFFVSPLESIVAFFFQVKYCSTDGVSFAEVCRTGLERSLTLSSGPTTSRSR